jgi:hypothetical protein
VPRRFAVSRSAPASDGGNHPRAALERLGERRRHDLPPGVRHWLALATALSDWYTWPSNSKPPAKTLTCKSSPLYGPVITMPAGGRPRPTRTGHGGRSSPHTQDRAAVVPLPLQAHRRQVDAGSARKPHSQGHAQCRSEKADNREVGRGDGGFHGRFQARRRQQQFGCSLWIPLASRRATADNAENAATSPL